MNEEYLIVKNPHADKEYRAEIIRRIKANGGYCPSKFERTPDTKCICKALKEDGECACGLFIKVPCIDVTEE